MMLFLVSKMLLLVSINLVKLWTTQNPLYFRMEGICKYFWTIDLIITCHALSLHDLQCLVFTSQSWTAMMSWFPCWYQISNSR